MSERTSLIALALFSSWLSIAQAADFSGLVVSVLDGDTIEVLHNHRPERIRLSGIDCPLQSALLSADAIVPKLPNFLTV